MITMTKTLGHAAYLLPLAIILAPTPGPTVSPVPFKSFNYSGVYQLENNGTILDMDVGRETDYHVDVSGLAVNLSCASSHVVDLDAARLELLRMGCARIIGTLRSPDEENAEKYAKAHHLGMWAPSVSPSSTTSKRHSWITVLLHWISVNIGLVLAILSCPVLVWLTRRISILFHKRRVNIIIAGVVAAGKTGLWTRWREQYDPSPNPSTSRVAARIDPVQLLNWTLLPNIIDIPGTQPEHLLAEVLRPRGINRAARARTKNVLVHVLSPCRQYAPPAGTQFATIDPIYVAEQKGYTESLPLALVRQHDPRLRLDLVIMFATKFDLFDSVNPKDAQGPALHNIEQVFKDHQKIIREACKEADVPFKWIVGSSKKEWGVEDLKNTVNRIIQ